MNRQSYAHAHLLIVWLNVMSGNSLSVNLGMECVIYQRLLLHIKVKLALFLFPETTTGSVMYVFPHSQANT